jgi:hypothetical protein
MENDTIDLSSEILTTEFTMKKCPGSATCCGHVFRLTMPIKGWATSRGAWMIRLEKKLPILMSNGIYLWGATFEKHLKRRLKLFSM